MRHLIAPSRNNKQIDIIPSHSIVRNLVPTRNKTRLIHNPNSVRRLVRIAIVRNARNIIMSHLGIRRPIDQDATTKPPKEGLTERIRGPDVVVQHLGTVHPGVDEDAETGIADLVVPHVGAVGLDTETDAIVGDDVLRDVHVGLVVHADGDEFQVGGLDRVAGDQAGLAPDGQDPVCQAVEDGVLPDLGVLGAHDGDVEAEAVDFETLHLDIGYVGADGSDFAVFGDEIGKDDVLSGYADPGFRAWAGEAAAGVFDEGGWEEEDGAGFGGELDAGFGDEELFVVFSGLDGDLGARVGGVDGGLDAGAWFDFDGVCGVGEGEEESREEEGGAAEGR